MADEARIEELPTEAGATDAPLRDRPSRHASAERLGGSSAPIFRSAAIVSALLGLAILKPWTIVETRTGAALDQRASGASVVSGTDGASSEGGAATGPGAVPVPSEPGSLELPPGAVGCEDPLGWRLVTLGLFAGRHGDARYVVEPAVGASGPADPRIPSIAAGQAPISAVGACGPSADPAVAEGSSHRPPARIVAAWRLDGPAAVPLPLATSGPTATSAAVAQLYAPSMVATAGLSADWGPGRYVVEVETGDQATSAWIGLAVSDPPPGALAASPEPETAP